MELKISKKIFLIFVLFIAAIFSLAWTPNDDVSVNEVVILSSSFNLRYIFLLPFTASLWKKFGVQPMIILIGEKSVFESNLQAKETIKFLKETNISVYYFQSKKLSSTSLSQIIRLFGAILPLPGHSISDETIFITSDADLAVFNRSNHIPSLKNHKTIHLYNSNCCEQVNVPPKRGNYAVKMYPMGTIGATRQTWKNIMNFKKDVFNIDEIEEYIQKEFGTEFFNPSDDTNLTLIGSSIWYSDQSLFSYKFDEWMKNPLNQKFASKNSNTPRRIDRIQWPTAHDFSHLTLKDFDDAHLPVETFSKTGWKHFYPFIQFAYKNDIELIRRFETYRKNFCKTLTC